MPWVPKIDRYLFKQSIPLPSAIEVVLNELDENHMYVAVNGALFSTGRDMAVQSIISRFNATESVLVPARSVNLDEDEVIVEVRTGV